MSSACLDLHGPCSLSGALTNIYHRQVGLFKFYPSHFLVCCLSTCTPRRSCNVLLVLGQRTFGCLLSSTMNSIIFEQHYQLSSFSHLDVLFCPASACSFLFLHLSCWLWCFLLTSTTNSTCISTIRCSTTAGRWWVFISSFLQTSTVPNSVSLSNYNVANYNNRYVFCTGRH